MIKFYLEEYLKEKNISLYWLHEVTGIRYATLMAMMKQNQKINLMYLDQIMEALNIKDVSILLKKEGVKVDEAQY